MTKKKPGFLSMAFKTKVILTCIKYDFIGLLQL